MEKVCLASLKGNCSKEVSGGRKGSCKGTDGEEGVLYDGLSMQKLS